MENELKYRNEDDKCYGVAGMTIGLLVFNGDKMLSSVSVDAPAGEMMDLTDDFYFSGNPQISASVVWRTLYQNFGLSVAMMISNAMCRRMVLDSAMVAPDVRRVLTERAAQEGASACGLDEDECREMFDRTYTQLFRVFNHRGVQSVAHEFAGTLKRRRHLSRFEVLDELRVLNSL